MTTQAQFESYAAVKVLFDQGVAEPLRAFLTLHSVATTAEMRWSTLANDDLLRAAEGQFDAFITTDKNLRYQQNMAGRRLAILVLPFTNWPRMKTQVFAIVAAVDALRPGDYVELQLE